MLHPLYSLPNDDAFVIFCDSVMKVCRILVTLNQLRQMLVCFTNNNEILLCFVILLIFMYHCCYYYSVIIHNCPSCMKDFCKVFNSHFISYCIRFFHVHLLDGLEGMW